jgi:hypothetical protein
VASSRCAGTNDFDAGDDRSRLNRPVLQHRLINDRGRPPCSDQCRGRDKTSNPVARGGELVLSPYNIVNLDRMTVS